MLETRPSNRFSLEQKLQVLRFCNLIAKNIKPRQKTLENKSEEIITKILHDKMFITGDYTLVQILEAVNQILEDGLLKEQPQHLKKFINNFKKSDDELYSFMLSLIESPWDQGGVISFYLGEILFTFLQLTKCIYDKEQERQLLTLYIVPTLGQLLGLKKVRSHTDEFEALQANLLRVWQNPDLISNYLTVCLLHAHYCNMDRNEYDQTKVGFILEQGAKLQAIRPGFIIELARDAAHKPNARAVFCLLGSEQLRSNQDSCQEIIDILGSKREFVLAKSVLKFLYDRDCSYLQKIPNETEKLVYLEKREQQYFNDLRRFEATETSAGVVGQHSPPLLFNTAYWLEVANESPPEPQAKRKLKCVIA